MNGRFEYQNNDNILLFFVVIFLIQTPNFLFNLIDLYLSVKMILSISITGCCHRKPLLVPGGRAFVWPGIQYVQR